MSGFEVDPELLTGLAQQLEKARTRLDWTHEGFLALDAEQLGSESLSEQVHAFEGAWSDGLWRLREELRAARDRVVAAAGTYGAADATVAGAACPREQAP